MNSPSATLLAFALILPVPLFAQARGTPLGTNAQLNAISAIETTPKSAAVTAARTALTAAAFAVPANPADITAKANALVAAELALAMSRADAFGALQASPNKLSAEQIVTMSGTIGRGARAGAAVSQPIDFDDHAGFESLFDGKTLNGWDFNPASWSVIDGAISADAANGAGFIYLKGAPVKDFELRLQAKLTGPSPGSGIMYRSRRNSELYNGSSVSGYQYDFGGRNWAQLVDQGGRSIITYPGEAAIDYAGNRHVRIADLGGALAFDAVKLNDWNQVQIIARGNTLIHIMNGRLMSLSIDEDPARNLEGVVALQVEGMGQVAFRDIWLKRL